MSVLPARRGINAWHWSVQILIGIFCVLVVAAIVVPLLLQFKGSRPAPNLSAVKQLGLALFMYANDHHDHLPTAKNPDLVEQALAAYIKSPRLWNLVPPAHGRFHVNGKLAGKALSTLKHPDKIALVYQNEPDDTGSRYVCFADAHARYVHADDWSKLR